MTSILASRVAYRRNERIEVIAVAESMIPTDDGSDDGSDPIAADGGDRMRDKADNNGIKVLVIDDSKTVRHSAELLLTKEGYRVTTAVDGFDALTKIPDVCPEIIFVDVIMPRLDGYQTCTLIKKHAEFGAIPVVMLSSKDGLFDKAKGRVVGSDVYLAKPFSLEDLLGTIRALVR